MGLSRDVALRDTARDSAARCGQVGRQPGEFNTRYHFQYYEQIQIEENSHFIFLAVQNLYKVY